VRRSNLLLAMLGLVTLMASLWVWVAVDPTEAGAETGLPIAAPGDADAPLPPSFAREAQPVAAEPAAPAAGGLPDTGPGATLGVDRTDLLALAVLTGRVTRVTDGTPVVGLTLEPAFSSKELVPEWSSATTDADGRYRFALAEDCVLQFLDAPSTPDTTRRRVSDEMRLALGETATLDVQLDAGATLVGIVVDGDTLPVAGATVLGWTERAWTLDTSPELARPPDQTITADALGRFTIGALGPRFVLSAEAPGMVCRWRLHGTLTDGSRTNGITLQLSPARHAPGQVLGPLELPLADVRISARDARLGPRNEVTGIEGVYRIGPAPVALRSDGGGSFLLGPLADIPYDIGAEHARHPPWRGTNEPGDAELLIRLTRGATLSGTIVSARGGPIDDAYIGFASTGESGFSMDTARSTRSDAQGRFELAGLLAEEHGLLLVRAGGHALHVEQPVVIREDGSHEIRIVLQPEQPLAGDVVDAEGAPVPDAIVRIVGDRLVDHGDVVMSPPPTWEGRFAGLDTTRTDEQGRFRFNQLYAGLFQVQAIHPEDESLTVRIDARSGVEDLRIVLDPDARSGVTLVGRVRDALTGRPVDAFSITPMIPQGLGGMTGTGHDFKDTEGSFHVTGLEPGQMMINVNAEGYAPWSGSLREFTPGEHLLDVQLLATRTLHVRVLDSMRQPVEGASLTFLDRDLREMFVASGMSSGTTRLSTDANGEAIAMRLPADHMSVRVERSFFGGHQDFIFDLRDEPRGVQELVLGEPEEALLLLILLTGEEPGGVTAAGADPEDTLLRIFRALEAGTARPLESIANVEAMDGLGRVVAERPFDPATPDPTVKLVVPGVERGWMLGLHVPSEPLELTVSAPGYVTEQRAWQPDRSGALSQMLVIFLRPE